MMTLSSLCEHAQSWPPPLKHSAVDNSRGGLMSSRGSSRANQRPDANRGMPKQHPKAIASLMTDWRLEPWAR